MGVLVVSVSEPLIPALLKPLLDRGFNGDGIRIWMVPVALVGVFGMRGVGSFLAQYALAKIANLGVIRLRRQLFDKIQTCQPALFRTENTSSINNTIIHEVHNGSTVLVNTLMTLGRDTLSLIALLAYLLYLNWQLIAVVLALFPVIFWVVRVTSRRLNRINRESLLEADQLAYTLEENVLAHREIRLQGAQREQSERFAAQSQRFMRLVMKSMVSAALVTPVTQLLTSLGLSAVISFALLQNALHGTSIGSFASFITGMLMLIAPIKHLSEITGPLNRGLISLERAFRFVEEHPDETSGEYDPGRVVGRVTFDNVTVKYPDRDAQAVRQIHFELPPGQVWALVGASGAGKTTLVNLLPRWIECSSGRVLIDGVPIQDYSLPALRRQIAMVSQNVVILNDTLLHNVCLGQAHDENRAMDCLRAANLGAWLDELPQGIRTAVGHNASQLSGGQRQRLAIARALYKNAPILILDEATSALDNESERLVQEALFKLSQNRTTLVIAHRLTTIERADHIVVLQEGEVVEMGTHAQLLEKRSVYWKLVNSGLSSHSA